MTALPDVSQNKGLRFTFKSPQTFHHQEIFQFDMVDVACGIVDVVIRDDYFPIALRQ